LVRFNRKTRDIVVECRPRCDDPAKEGTGQYPGWPVRLNQLDNFGREATAYLPKIISDGIVNPVIQVIDEDNLEVIYMIRMNGNSFRPKVFKPGSYTIQIGEPDKGHYRILRGIKSGPITDERILKVSFT